MIFGLSAVWIICAIFIVNNGNPNLNDDNSDIFVSAFVWFKALLY